MVAGLEADRCLLDKVTKRSQFASWLSRRQEWRGDVELLLEERSLLSLGPEPRDVAHPEHRVERHHLRGDPDCAPPASMTVVRFLDSVVERAPSESIDRSPIAGRLDADVSPVDELADKRRRRPAALAVEECVVLAAQEVAAVECDQLQETGLTAGVAERADGVDSFPIGHSERMSAVNSRSSRTALPPPEEPPSA